MSHFLCSICHNVILSHGISNIHPELHLIAVAIKSNDEPQTKEWNPTTKEFAGDLQPLRLTFYGSSAINSRDAYGINDDYF